MNRTVKIFCTGNEQDRVVEDYNVIERYEGFVLAEVKGKLMDQLLKKYPLEDITDQYTLKMGSKQVNTTVPRFNSKGKLSSHPAYKGVKHLSSGKHHHLVQFIGPAKKAWTAEIVKKGGEIRSYYNGFAYIVRADEKGLMKINALPYVRWIGHLSHSDRISTHLTSSIEKGNKLDTSLPRTRILDNVFTVEFFSEKDLGKGVAEVKKLGFKILKNEKNGKLLVLEFQRRRADLAKSIGSLSAVHGVRSIYERAIKRTSNNVATKIMETKRATLGSGLGLTGKGEIIGVCDTGLDSGDPQNIHPDFKGRTEWVGSYPITSDFTQFINNPGGDDGPADLDSGHGTHVAGSILGDGTSSAGLSGEPIRGLAHEAKLVFQAVEQEIKWKNPSDLEKYGRYLLAGIPHDLKTLFSDAYAKNVRIHSNSWGGGDPGAYDSQCEQLDSFVWEHKDFCVLFANGNDGTDKDGDGKINPMSVSSPATAKNCISIGASENRRLNFNNNTYGGWWASDYPSLPYDNDPMANNPDQVAAFSSRGPTQDGRIKPDVVAPGTFILSTRSRQLSPGNKAWAAFPPSNKYFHMGGTSMATPLAAGAVALIRQYLRKKKQIQKPSAALLKAALISGATRLLGYANSGAIWDNHQGYGRVNIDALVAPNPPVSIKFNEIKPGLETGEVHAISVNVKSGDVPLRIVLAYTDFPGQSLVNNLNLIAKGPNGIRHLGNQPPNGDLVPDTNNNVEVVHVPHPVPGKWEIEVISSNTPHGPQDFALIYSANVGELDDKTVVFSEVTPDLKIPDSPKPGVKSVIKISNKGKVKSMKVNVDIEHTYIGDLQIGLTPPGQETLLLHDRSGASANNIDKTYDAFNTPELSLFNGIEMKGNWELSITDKAGADTGRLIKWSLEITSMPISGSIKRENTPARRIPDNSNEGITDVIEINKKGVIKDIEVRVDITHTWIGDLIVDLVTPTGAIVNLHNRLGSSKDNIIKTYQAENVSGLGALIGENAKGSWELVVKDLAGRDTGKLNQWGVEISL